MKYMREAREPNTLENLKAKIAAGLAKIPVNISREQNLGWRGLNRRRE